MLARRRGTRTAEDAEDAEECSSHRTIGSLFWSSDPMTNGECHSSASSAVNVSKCSARTYCYRIVEYVPLVAGNQGPDNTNAVMPVIPHERQRVSGSSIAALWLALDAVRVDPDTHSLRSLVRDDKIVRERQQHSWSAMTAWYVKADSTRGIDCVLRGKE